MMGFKARCFTKVECLFELTLLQGFYRLFNSSSYAAFHFAPFSAPRKLMAARVFSLIHSHTYRNYLLWLLHYMAHGSAHNVANVGDAGHSLLNKPGQLGYI
ncbi:hypothetical protein ES703_116733 [subsurface metagenome]